MVDGAQDATVNSATLTWGDSAETFLVAMAETGIDGIQSELEVLRGRLSLAVCWTHTAIDETRLVLTLNKKLRYVPFCADFGPLNLGTTHHVGAILQRLLSDRKRARQKVVFAVQPEQLEPDLTNAIYLLGAFMVLRLGATPEQAWAPFAGLDRHLVLPYRDATWTKSTFDLHVRDLWAGLRRATAVGIYDFTTFDKTEYFYYDNPVNGDLHEVVPGKFIAFKGPKDADFRDSPCDMVDMRLSVLCRVHAARTRAHPAHGRTYLQGPESYTEIFKDKNVELVVRLNTSQYSRRPFLRAGVNHLDLFFADCTSPPDQIVHEFLIAAEECKGMVAVHCAAGLGRTGTLIALYLMKHHGFTGRECIAWMRVARPGSIIGPQQKYLVLQEDRMHRLGREGAAGLGVGWEDAAGVGLVGLQEEQGESGDAGTPERSKQMSEMVMQGVAHRNQVYLGDSSVVLGGDPAFVQRLGRGLPTGRRDLSRGIGRKHAQAVGAPTEDLQRGAGEAAALTASASTPSLRRLVDSATTAGCALLGLGRNFPQSTTTPASGTSDGGTIENDIPEDAGSQDLDRQSSEGQLDGFSRASSSLSRVSSISLFSLPQLFSRVVSIPGNPTKGSGEREPAMSRTVSEAGSENLASDFECERSGAAAEEVPRRSAGRVLRGGVKGVDAGEANRDEKRADSERGPVLQRTGTF